MNVCSSIHRQSTQHQLRTMNIRMIVIKQHVLSCLFYFMERTSHKDSNSLYFPPIKETTAAKPHHEMPISNLGQVVSTQVNLSLLTSPTIPSLLSQHCSPYSFYLNAYLVSLEPQTFGFPLDSCPDALPVSHGHLDASSTIFLITYTL